MPDTRAINARVSMELEQRARARAPELSDIESSMLVRVALAVLAGERLPRALRTARDDKQKPGRKPKSKPETGHQAAA